MKILRVITWLPPGGIERRLVAILPRLRDEQGIEPELVCIRERGALADDLEAAGIRVHVCPLRSRWDPRGLLRLRDLIRDGGFDLVHSHMYRSNVPATVAARLEGVPIVGQVHNVDTWTTRRQAMVDRWLCRWRTGMIGVSRRVAADIERRLGLPSEKIHVVYNGVEIGDFAPDAAVRERVRAELSIEADRLVFLCPARLHPQKNHAGLLRAWEAALERLGDSVAPPLLLLPGKGSAHDAVERQIAEIGARSADIGGSIRLLGHSDSMADLYRAADAMILASFKEGFSNALIEGMAAGLAPIASDVGGNAEAVEHGSSGLIVPPGDDAALTEAIGRLIEDAAERGRLAEGALDRCRSFSLDAMVERTAALYAEILGAAR